MPTDWRSVVAATITIELDGFIRTSRNCVERKMTIALGQSDVGIDQRPLDISDVELGYRVVNPRDGIPTYKLLDE